MEEPRITMTTKNDYKCLLGGDRFEIDVKYGARRFLQRIPVIATTNEDLGSLLTSVDKAALYSRVKQYCLNEQISSELIRGTIPKCPVTLCACHLRQLFMRYGFYGDKQCYIVASSWDFCYPPNEKSRLHCARIIYDSVGQPDQISMKRTNSGYEVCELQWHLRNTDEIPESIKNWDLLGRIEIALPAYEDTTDGEVAFETTYTATFKLIDRHYEIFNTRDWKRPPQNFLWTLREFEDVNTRDEHQRSIVQYIDVINK